ncbi:hypothetical protein L1987_57483 [Smallanthus sonchifolius]|uniref:Uncharacterized protein n=1 Tax=Smallanthus sonchifolius TaxID=185202 RepID=A0ACB9DD54_9ASTR|nr:hypothetical protein L1987_57483 [Smallanthus sonchifolius]
MVSRRIIYTVSLISLLLLGSTMMGAKARRVNKGDDDHKGLLSMLPRGIVPPSGPSPCHNILERKRTHRTPPASSPPFAPPFVPPFSPQFPLPFDPPPPPPDEIICP